MSGRNRNRPSQDTIDRVELPANIKCLTCNRNKILARYSNNQQKKYKEQIYLQGALKATRPNCLECTGTPKLELKCADCGKVKSLEHFSKNARTKDRDNALCWDCQQRVSDVEPKLEDAIKEQEIMEELKSRGSSAFSMTGLGSTLPAGSKNSSGRSETGTDATGRVWVQPPLSPGRAAASRGRNELDRGDESTRHRSSSQETDRTHDTYQSGTTTSKGTWGNIGRDLAYGPPPSNRSSVTASDRWVKQGGGHKKTAEQKAAEAYQRSQQQDQQRVRDDDSDSDSSEFEM